MILNIDKPAGITSHDVVGRVRHITGEKRVGHGGTLDPFATGVLIIAIGRESTKKLAHILKGVTKEYEATIELGKTSTTGDPEGRIEKTSGIHTVQSLPLSKIEEAIDKFRGETIQSPPAYSAIKVGGVRAYQLARRGIFPTLKKRQIKIDLLEIIKYHPPMLQIKASVSSGTYIRKLAEDIGKELGTGGYLIKLKRTRVGDYKLTDSQTLGDLEKNGPKI
jgi:tRNA pseudouridine55 synthase